MAGASPQVRIAGECARRGRREVVAGCVSILQGDEPDPSLLAVLGGAAAPRLLAGDSRADVDLWSRVWAVRGLLWALDPETVEDAEDAIAGALRDAAWRVREKAAQVVARHLVDAALSEVVALGDADPVPRVRSAANRAVRRLTTIG
jgi:hypothetical protein